MCKIRFEAENNTVWVNVDDIQRELGNTCHRFINRFRPALRRIRGEFYAERAYAMDVVRRTHEKLSKSYVLEHLSYIEFLTSSVRQQQQTQQLPKSEPNQFKLESIPKPNPNVVQLMAQIVQLQTEVVRLMTQIV